MPGEARGAEISSQSSYAEDRGSEVVTDMGDLGKYIGSALSVGSGGGTSSPVGLACKSVDDFDKNEKKDFGFDFSLSVSRLVFDLDLTLAKNREALDRRGVSSKSTFKSFGSRGVSLNFSPGLACSASPSPSWAGNIHSAILLLSSRAPSCRKTSRTEARMDSRFPADARGGLGFRGIRY